MIKRFHSISFLFLITLCIKSVAQDCPTNYLPDVLGYKTLKCDLHIHSIFSDGTVWPTVRVEEAWREGLDVIAITDHIENRRYLKVIFQDEEIIPGTNMSYEIAKVNADKRNIILIRGGEITRIMPPGHLNAIFLSDVDKLKTPDWEDAVMEAKKQGAFITWNHPGWRNQQPDSTLWSKAHTWLLENGMMNGIEVVNEKSYYPEAHRWALEKQLTFLANSDIHEPVNMIHDPEKGENRPMTIVFAKERNLESVKEALFDHRTVAYYDNKLIGEEKYLNAIFMNSIKIVSVERASTRFNILLYNSSFLRYELSKDSGNDPKLGIIDKIVISPRGYTSIQIYSKEPSSYDKFDLKYIIENLLITPEVCLPVTMSFIPDS